MTAIEQRLQKVNKFALKELTQDEVYIFDIILCDNNIDRDNEAFSDDALEVLKAMFVGKTGIFDHDAKGSNQTARIFETEISYDQTRVTAYGKTYKYLKAGAYMARTSSNADLIREIEAGIKKEVSISCDAKSRKCSVCGTDKRKASCVHVKGVEYSGEKCYVVLDDVKDAYEWSFVAVPAQKEAGTTKKYTDYCESETFSGINANQAGKDGSEAKIKALETQIADQKRHIALFGEEIKKDVIKLCTVKEGEPYAKIISETVEKMSAQELLETRKALSQKLSANVSRQIYRNADINAYKG